MLNWQAMGDEDKSILVARELLKWRSHPMHTRLWIAAKSQADDFSDAPNRPAVTLPAFLTSRDAATLVVRTCLQHKYDAHVRLSVIEQDEAQRLVCYAKFECEGHTGEAKCYGRYAYCEAVCLAGLRFSGIAV